MKEFATSFGSFILKCSIFFSDAPVHTQSLGTMLLVMLSILFITQFITTLLCHDFFDFGFNKYIIPSLLLTLSINLIINLLIILIGIQLHPVGLFIIELINIISTIIICLNNGTLSTFNITNSITDYFDELKSRDNILKEYKENYLRSIKKSERIWEKIK